MMPGRFRERGWGPLVCALALSFSLFCRDGYACLVNHYSIDFLVANSPLILIGEVTHVSSLPKRSGGWFMSADDEPGPSLARVEVARVLHGRWQRRSLRVHSGPIRSCAPYAVHYSFSLAETRVFILPYPPRAGEVRLEFGRSNLPPSEVELVENRIQRALVFKEAYLVRLGEKRPETHQAAVALDKEMQTASQDWPGAWDLPPSGSPRLRLTDEEETLLEPVVEKLVERLASADIEVIQAAVAMDFHDEEPWAQRLVWKAAMQLVASKRPTEVAALHRAWIQDTLAAAGCTKQQIEKYLPSLSQEYVNSPLVFPLKGPPTFGFSPGDAELFTTDFILRFSVYDRGDMFRTYGMGFEHLARLQPSRLTVIVPALYASADGDLRSVGRWAIAYMPGTDFVDVVLGRLFEGGYTDWRALVNPEDKAQTSLRLKALVGLAYEDSVTPFGRKLFWRALRQGECFEDVCIEAAIDRLAQEQSKVRQQQGGPSPDDSSVRALEEYLLAAMAHRQENGSRLPSAEKLRQWFTKHPAPKNGR